jgi:type I restriction-modification system DNA methylase subunit
LTADIAAAHARMLELIERFERYADSRYLKPDYQEAEARKDFIDPMFKALGWDVDHERESNPYEQEVKVERGVEVARSQKRADYAFYVAPRFNEVRFFVEAKKPSVALDRNIDAHFQTWRYGYSANTPLAVLTDFEEIHVLDCRPRPHADNALSQVHKRWHYKEFRDSTRFAEFYWLFSREAHAQGAFARYVESLPKAKGRARQRGLLRTYKGVDADFLAELEGYRVALAKAFKKSDETLDSESLTAIVQRTLDRLVFLRFLEDKQIETEIRVTDFGKSARGAWGDFLVASRRLDAIYNGIVFKRLDQLDDASRAIDDNVFADICERLAAENSAYSFDAIPIHILGSIYERFLGSVIRATDKRAVVEEKPEVRKAGGVYYTPEYIVRYIVANTVGKLIDGKAPDEVAKQRFADIACGSGSFLLGVFDELLCHHAQWYNRPENDRRAKKDGCVRGDDGLWRLSLAQRRTILQNNLFGVDIDPQAVEVAQLSLFLKLLEDERATSARQHQLDYARDAHMKKLLPDLSKNIVCGNSLIGWDIEGVMTASAMDQRNLNPLSFNDTFAQIMQSGGFDAVVGNPPYVRIQTLKETNPFAAELLRENYRSAAKGNYDIYVTFIERGLSLLNAKGKLGFIVPHKFFNAKYGEHLRGLVADGKHLDAIIHFGDQQVFAGATTYTCLIFLGHGKLDEFAFTRVADLVAWQEDKRGVCGTIAADHASSAEWNFVVGDASQLVRRLLGSYPTLEESSEIFVGVQTSADDVFILESTNVAGVFKSAIQSESVELEPGLLHPLLSGVDVDRYLSATVRQELVFPYVIAAGKAQLIPWQGLQTQYPKLATYLSKHRKRLEDREGGRMKTPSWYGYIYLKNMARQSLPKVTVPRLVTRLCAGYDNGLCYLDNVDVGGVTFTPDNAQHDLRYLTGLLNSRLLGWLFPSISAPFRGGFMSANRQFLGQLPFRRIDFSDSTDKSHHDRLVAFVEQMLEAKKQEAAASGQARDVATRKCAALDRQIDALVYELYGLSSEEIALVEGRIEEAASA